MARVLNPEVVERYRTSEKGRSTHRKQSRKWAAANTDKVAERDRRYREANPEKRTRNMAAFYEAHPDYLRTRNLKRFGLTVAGYNALFGEQGGRCAICGVHQSDLPRSLCVDHDHERGVVRGLLCGHCNLVLGHARDSARVLLAAVTYLEGR